MSARAASRRGKGLSESGYGTLGAASGSKPRTGARPARSEADSRAALRAAASSGSFVASPPSAPQPVRSLSLTPSSQTSRVQKSYELGSETAATGTLPGASDGARFQSSD